jgi:hypothetical protein
MTASEAAQVAAFDPRQVPPPPCTGRQCRGIGGPALHVEAWGGPLGQERCDAVTAMPRGPVPKEPQTAGPLAPQMVQQGDAIDRVDRLRLTVHRELTCRGAGADRRALIPAPPFPEDGGLASWGRRADDTGQGRAPGCIDAAERLPLRWGPLLRAGQVSSRPRVRAASSRGRARRAGWCGLRRMAWHTRPTGRGCDETPHASGLTAAMRARVPPWPRKPSAAAPRCSCAGHGASCAAESRRGAPGGARCRSASRPPSRARVSHCLTAPVLTPSASVL